MVSICSLVISCSVNVILIFTTHNKSYHVLSGFGYFHFMLYKNFAVHVEKAFISSKIPNSPLNFSPKKLYHTIWFINMVQKLTYFAQNEKTTDMVPFQSEKVFFTKIILKAEHLALLRLIRKKLMSTWEK